MKFWMHRGVFVVILGLGVLLKTDVSLGAPCNYFLVGVDKGKITPLKSKEKSKEKSQDRDSNDTETSPEAVLDDPMEPLFEVDCDCNYALQGSNVLCSYEKTVNQKEIVSGPDRASVQARSNNSLCECVSFFQD